MADNIHAGHRKRMKQEFLARGLEGMPDHRVLELLLFFAIPQGDVNPLAHALMHRFGSLDAVFRATHNELLSVKGVGENTATLINLILPLNARYSKSMTDLDSIYFDSPQFKELLEPEFYGARNELVYMVCLDAKRKFLPPPHKIGEGSLNGTDVSTRRVLETALAHNAAFVVLAHNHPSGLAIPSTRDISTTQHLARSLLQVGITLADHCIFADGDMVSMRDSGYLTNL